MPANALAGSAWSPSQDNQVVTNTNPDGLFNQRANLSLPTQSHADDRDPGTHRRVYLQDAPGPKQDLGSEQNDEDVTVPNMAKKLVKILKIIKI